jgi:hypothetical protein
MGITDQPERVFACRICGKTFAPPAEEAQVLAELERQFKMKAENASSVCEECAGRSVQ